MPLTYRHLRGRADFRPLLDHVIAETRRLALSGGEPWPVGQSVLAQLEAIRRWTDDDRDPTLEERKSVSLGKLVARELEPAANQELGRLNEQLMDLADYVKRWLTDAGMAAFDADDLMNDFYEWDR